MIKHRPILFRYLLYIIALAGWMTSCNTPNRNNQSHLLEIERSKSLTQKAGNYLDAHPDSALIAADSALKLLQGSDVEGDELYQLYQIKANAWQNLEQPDSALLWLQKKYDFSLTSSDSVMQARSLFKLIRYKIRIGHIENNPGDQIDRLAALFHRLGLEYERAKALSLYDDWCNQTGEVLTAQKYLIEACEIYDKLDSTEALSAVYINIGNNLKQIGSNHEALQYYEKSAEIARLRNDTLNIAKALINSGIVYRTLNPDSAIICYEAVANLLAGTNLSYYKISNSFNLASIYADKNNYTKAREMFEQVLNLCLETGNYEGVAYAYSGLAALFKEEGNYAKAISFNKKSIEIADSLREFRLSFNLKKQMYKSYKISGEWKNAALMNEQITAIADSMMSVEKQVAIHQLEIDYQTQKKELENTMLKEKVHTQEHILSLRQFFIFILSVGLLVVIVLLWYAHRLYRQRGFAYQALLAKFKTEMLQPSPVNDESVNDTFDPDAESRQLMNKILEYFSAEKPYLDHKLRVDEVAEKLETNRKAVASALKNHDHHNFNTFCNIYRVEEAKKLLVSTDLENYTLEAIGDKSGFGSRQSFYAVFQQSTGMRPTYFRENLRSNTSENA